MKKVLLKLRLNILCNNSITKILNQINFKIFFKVKLDNTYKCLQKFVDIDNVTDFTEDIPSNEDLISLIKTGCPLSSEVLKCTEELYKTVEECAKPDLEVLYRKLTVKNEYYKYICNNDKKIIDMINAGAIDCWIESEKDFSKCWRETEKHLDAIPPKSDCEIFEIGHNCIGERFKLCNIDNLFEVYQDYLKIVRFPYSNCAATYKRNTE